MYDLIWRQLLFESRVCGHYRSYNANDVSMILFY